MDKKPKKRRKLLRVILTIIGILIGLILLIAAVIYFWPFQTAKLMNPPHDTSSYDQAITAIENDIANEKKMSNLKPECTSKLYTHGTQTEKTVVMLHGYTACPAQFDQLAQQFFSRGYNVYIPRAPYHGLKIDSRAYTPLTKTDLVDYANTSVARATGLGKNVGVMGISGGGMLATWLATNRPDVVERALVISPFYKPAEQSLPGWEVRPVAFLYGYKIIPEGFSKPNYTGFSIYGLGQYLQLTDNINTSRKLPKLKQLSVVYSEGDTAVDHKTAERIPSEIAKSNNNTTYDLFVIPGSWGVGHDAVAPNQPDINGHEDELYKKYIELYEGKN